MKRKSDVLQHIFAIYAMGLYDFMEKKQSDEATDLLEKNWPLFYGL